MFEDHGVSRLYLPALSAAILGPLVYSVGNDYGVNLPQYLPSGAVSVGVSGAFSLSTGTPTAFYSKNWQGKDMLSWTHGRHLMKFGYELVVWAVRSRK